MKATEAVSVRLQGPSKVLHTVYDNVNYQKHRRRVAEIDADVSRTMDTLATEHLVNKSNLGPQFIETERAETVERDNKNLFNKIESIIKRQGPYKLQPSSKNPKKLTKVFHAPSDHTIKAASYIARPSWNMKDRLQALRDVENRRLQTENQKLLDRIQASKPSI